MHRSRILAALGTIIGLGLALMPPAGAAENMDPTVVVLDASGSMLQKDVGGQTRMDAAKQATTEFVSEAPKDAQLGLVTYGTGTGSSDAEARSASRPQRTPRRACPSTPLISTPRAPNSPV